MLVVLTHVYQWLIGQPLPKPLKNTVQGITLLIRRLLKDQVLVRAATLSYWSLVAIVPVLVLGAVVLRAIGMDTADFRAVLYRTLLAGSVSGVGEQLDAWIGNLDFGRLGVAGVLGVLWTGSRIFFRAEDAYNHIWGTRVREGLLGRLLLFYAWVTLGPIVLVWGFHWTHELEVDLSFFDRLTPLLLSTAAFVAAIRLLPATNVKWGPAVSGGLLSGILFEAAKAGFNTYIAILGSAGTAIRLYGSIALFPIFLLWLNILWLIVLLGVELAYVIQYWKELQRQEARRLAGEREVVPDGWVAVQAVAVVAGWFDQKKGACPEAELAGQLGLEELAVQPVLEVLEEANILAKSEQGWLPAKPPESIPVREILAAWRGRVLPPLTGPGACWVESVLEGPSLSGRVVDVLHSSPLEKSC
jgi:membrane protein